MKYQFYGMALAAFFAGLLVWLAFFWEPGATGQPAPDQKHGLLLPAGQQLGGDFTLDTAGGKLSLQDYRGKVVLIYFGYTFCPDVCPPALAAMAQALSALTPEEQKRVGGIFVSVDPERDTPEVLKVYAPFFHPGITGATGSPEQIAEIARRYGVVYMKQKPVDDRPYAVDHSSFTYLIDLAGKLDTILPHATPAPEIVAAIRRNLDKPAQ